MALFSARFRGDSKLEAAAVSDPAHITQGARGDHVRKIQLALIQLDGAKIDPDGNYGPATAAAVLAYKRKRNIVNRSYQTQADNIVGKMTMAALDAELLLQEQKPVFVQSLSPPAGFPRGFESTLATGRISALRQSFAVGDGGAPKPTAPVGRPPAPVISEVVISPGQSGTIQVVGGNGGTLLRFQESDQKAFAKLKNAKRSTNGLEEIDIGSDLETFTYVGERCADHTFFQWVGPDPPGKRSGILSVLVLPHFSEYEQDPVRAPDSRFKSGLLSVEATPLNPRAGGRNVNLFGRGESNGFADFSTSIKFCEDSPKTKDSTNKPGEFLLKPWTNDPRKPGAGLEPKSVKNICCRNSPVFPVTIDEIDRIAAPGCRITFAGDRGFAELLRKTYVESGRANKPLDEGPCGGGFGGFAIIFELKG